MSIASVITSTSGVPFLVSRWFPWSICSIGFRRQTRERDNSVEIGTKQTCRSVNRMSALWRKPDLYIRKINLQNHICNPPRSATGSAVTMKNENARPCGQCVRSRRNLRGTPPPPRYAPQTVDRSTALEQIPVYFTHSLHA